MLKRNLIVIISLLSFSIVNCLHQEACPESWQIEIGGSCVDKCQILPCRQCYHAVCGPYEQNKEFMAGYQKLEKEFLKQTPLMKPEEMKFPLSTEGMKIVDATGQRVKLVGANWYGFHLSRQVINGLDKRKLKDIVHQIRSLFGLNSIRMTFSLQMLNDKTHVKDQDVSMNPQFIGMTPLQVMDRVIAQLTSQNVMVYLNNHVSDSMWCCNIFDHNGLWYNSNFPEKTFFAAMEFVAQRYKNNSLVIGIDLRNQIRPDSIRIPVWQAKGLLPALNWRTAAQTAAEIVQKAAPDWLIIIGGINFQTDLKDIVKYPITLPKANKLIYSGHLYQWIFQKSSKTLQQNVFDFETHVRGIGVPFILGEFGQNNSSNWWKGLMQILQKTGLDWTYWPLNGYQQNTQQDETYGLYDKDFLNVRHPWMVADLKKVGAFVQ